MGDTETPAAPRPARPRLRRLWAVVKALVVAAVVIAVGWQFASILDKPDLWSHPPQPQPGWLAAAAALYLVGLGYSALFWYILLRARGQRPGVPATLRAFYVGQLGRYVPGKVVGLGLRARLLVGPGVRQSVAVLTVVYETLTTLAAGVLLGLAWFAIRAPGHADWVWRAVALLAVVGVVLLPAVFNRLAGRTARAFRTPDAPPLPRVRGKTLAAGLALTACGWLAQGGALWAVVESLTPGAWASPMEAWGRCAAYVALAYAAGFLVFAAPQGMGVRDFILQQFLAADLSRTLGPEQAAAAAVVAALVLRLLWTVLDVAAAAACYRLPGQGGPPAKTG